MPVPLLRRSDGRPCPTLGLTTFTPKVPKVDMSHLPTEATGRGVDPFDMKKRMEAVRTVTSF